MAWETVTDAGQAIADPVVTFVNSVVEILPGFVGALLLGVLGYIVATFIGLLIKKGLVKAGLDSWLESTGKHSVLGDMSLSYMLGGMVKWYLFALFLIPAVGLVKLEMFSMLLAQIALWIPKLLTAILVIIIGLIAADITVAKLNHANKITWVRVLTPFIKFFVIVFFLDVALKQVGIRFDLAESTYLIILGGTVLMLAFAIGIPLGFALRKEAEDFVKHLKKKM
ncbi:MAG TPA: hypothetical protein VK158_06455 [Acidobacteriota bacterium]|nr:hypothetical protein [Acidobacteriota bacterium]